MPQSLNDVSLGKDEFNAIARLAYDESGLQLVAEKSSMIQSRLRHRLKALGLADFGSYASLVCSAQGKEERRHMISALTTNVSHFFREQHHFDLLAGALKDRLPSNSGAGQRIRIWSAGCSNGQEALSIAITFLETVPDPSAFDFKILATDIDPKVVRFASDGMYPDRFMGGVPDGLRDKYFDQTSEFGESTFKAKPEIRNLVTFKELNLLASWPMKLEMDFIFCRNVVIYFDLKTQNALWPRFHKQLKPDGYLFLGHSERVAEPENVGFHSSGPTTYRPIAVEMSNRPIS